MYTSEKYFEKSKMLIQNYVKKNTNSSNAASMVQYYRVKSPYLLVEDFSSRQQQLLVTSFTVNNARPGLRRNFRHFLYSKPYPNQFPKRPLSLITQHKQTPFPNFYTSPQYSTLVPDDPAYQSPSYPHNRSRIPTSCSTRRTPRCRVRRKQ